MGIEKFIRRIAVQTAVYWGNPVDDGYGGLTFDDPVEIKCRWEDTAELITAADGEQYVTKANIMVTQDVDVNGYLLLGTLNNLDSDQMDDPKEVSGACRIRQFAKVPMIRSTSAFVRKAMI
jgi:hypothetical protein